MKRMLTSGYQKIFQIGPCFRFGEWGSRHRSEFTMLEWYETEADYLSILERTKTLCRSVAQTLGLREVYFGQEWEILTVEKAFEFYANMSVDRAIAQNIFEEVLCDKVEPFLGVDTPTVLIDYPASMAALSRKKIDNPKVAERWELYVNGLELANAYSELTDASEQRQRFLECSELRRSAGRVDYGLDEEFLHALEDGLPECGGIAVGIDRLCMSFLGLQEIENVVFE
jgi:elongation factor P--(R)-beta-lysine ligase